MKYLLICLVAVSSAFAIPQLINYQGQLTSPAGAPLDTTVTMTFRLYGTLGGSTASWTETHAAVAVTDGLFNVLLGSVTVLPDSFAVNRWLGITVGNNTEMTPRQQVVSVAHAYRVGTVDGASGGNIEETVVINNGSLVAGINNNGDFDMSLVIGADNSVFGSFSSVAGGTNQQTDSAYSFIGGGQTNRTTGSHAAIGGGGSNVSGSHAFVGGGFDNHASGQYSVVGGGTQDSATAQYSAVLGGNHNTAKGSGSTISGGSNNLSSGASAAIGGGAYNKARGDFSVVAGGGGFGGSDTNSAVANFSAIGGGRRNSATGINSSIGGGFGNTASGNSSNVAGGQENEATATYANVSGGLGCVASGSYSHMGGGQYNYATGNHTAICGGWSNQTRDYATNVGGGVSNIADSIFSCIGGGHSNHVAGVASCIPGGEDIELLGDYTFGCGSRIRSSSNNALIFCDGTENFTPGASNTANFLTTGGFRIWTANPFSSNIGTRLAPGGTSWVALSDSTTKENRRDANGPDVLSKLSNMPVDRWNYKHQDETVEHIGPMAQDFWSSFHLGSDSLGIETLDADGVLFAAVKELAQRNTSLEARVKQLEQLLLQQSAITK